MLMQNTKYALNAHGKPRSCLLLFTAATSGRLSLSLSLGSPIPALPALSVLIVGQTEFHVVAGSYLPSNWPP